MILINCMHLINPAWINLCQILIALKKNPVYATGFFNSSKPVVSGYYGVVLLLLKFLAGLAQPHPQTDAHRQQYHGKW